ncbi:uncharacterized protein LOC112088195 [Eutrema salsugineum]|uniref:uncharacterized protein LOC112088195 n=1 Tax=Eutrema salsugineum TaxID=72664 RepID=UPI000CED52C6|nr:uncharacterized protein LOC112088195 [Eutrema salsugineum]
MASSSYNDFNNGFDENYDENFVENVDDSLDDQFDDLFDQKFDKALNSFLERQTVPKPKKKKKRAYIERNREEGHIRLWNDYFSEDATYPPNLFRRRFRMNKSLFMRIVGQLSQEMPFFQQRRDATGRVSLSGLQKCTATIRMLAYGSAADAVDEYLRLGESTAISCLEHFTEGIISSFGDEYLRRPTREDLQRLLNEGEDRGFPGMVGSIDCTLNDINVLDRSPVFDDVLQGRAPKVRFSVNGNQYRLGYYLTDGIYPNWATFIQSIHLPQSEKEKLFATRQESVRKDVERAFGVLQARFAIVKNPALIWDKEKISKIMRTCIMIVEDERKSDTQYNLSEFEQGEGTRSSQVDMTYSTYMPTNIGNMIGIRNQVRDNDIHQQLKNDLVEHIWHKFG